MDNSSVKASLRAFEEHVEAYLEHLRLAHQITQEQKAHDDETLKIQANIDAVNGNIAELNLNSENILKTNESIERDIESLNIKIADTEAICTEISKGMKLRSSDVSRFSKARNMWYIAEDITGINWNYSAPQNLISGFIVNKSDKSLKSFEYDTTKLSMDQISNDLWNKIESMSLSKWEDIKEAFHSEKILINKENVPMNV